MAHTRSSARCSRLASAWWPDHRDAARRSRVAWDLLRAGHPGPSLTGTLVASLLAWGSGYGLAGTLVVAVAILSGQLSIAWCNDAHDAEADASVGRQDKPAATGQLPVGLVWAAAVAGLVVTVPASVLAAGWLGGAAHVGAVMLAWSYNLWLHRTAWSFLPFAAAFALLPAFVTLGADPSRWPAMWSLVAFASLGVVAHLVNGLRDLDIDRKAGVGGVVTRLGAGPSRLLTLVGVLCAGVATASATGTAPHPSAWVLPATGFAVFAAALWLAPARARFRALLLAAVVAVVALVWATAVGAVSLSGPLVAAAG